MRWPLADGRSEPKGRSTVLVRLARARLLLRSGECCLDRALVSNAPNYRHQMYKAYERGLPHGQTAR